MIATIIFYKQIVFVNKSDSGATEENYINLLKGWYKSPIKIVSHIEGPRIIPSLAESRTKELKISQWDNNVRLGNNMEKTWT